MSCRILPKPCETLRHESSEVYTLLICPLYYHTHMDTHTRGLQMETFPCVATSRYRLIPHAAGFRHRTKVTLTFALLELLQVRITKTSPNNYKFTQTKQPS
jgi:hypothetical protein